MTQKTIVERMKPLYPALTQPIVSAVARGRAGVQWTNAFRRDAEAQGLTVKRDRDGRVLPSKFTVRLTDAEAAEFYRYLNGTGETAQEVLRNLVLNLIGGR
jgi:hypothetical protein